MAIFNLENLKKAMAAAISRDGGKLLTPAERLQKVNAGETIYNIGSVRLQDGSYVYGETTPMTPKQALSLATPVVDWRSKPAATITTKTKTIPTAATAVGIATIQETTNDVSATDGMPAGWVDTPVVSSNTMGTVVGVILLLVLINFISLPFKMLRRR